MAFDRIMRSAARAVTASVGAATHTAPPSTDCDPTTSSKTAASSSPPPISKVQHLKLSQEQLLRKFDEHRQRKLKEFLSLHAKAAEWRRCIKALHDAEANGVVITSDMITPAIRAAGYAKQFSHCRTLFYDYHRRLRIHRCTSATHAFLSAAAACGADVAAITAVHHVIRHIKRQERRLLEEHRTEGEEEEVEFGREGRNPTEAANASDPPDRVPSSFVNMALRACCTAQRKCQEQSPDQKGVSDGDSVSLFGGVEPLLPPTAETSSGKPNIVDRLKKMQPWQRALSFYAGLRDDGNPLWRPEPDANTARALAELFYFCGMPKRSQAILRAVERRHIEVAPEVYDCVLQTQFRAAEHLQVVLLIQRMAAARIAPNEASARMALVSCEEVAARVKLDGPLGETDDQRTISTQTADLSVKLFNGLADNGYGLMPQTYECVIRTCLAEGEIDKASAIIGEMRKDGLAVPEHVTKLLLLAQVAAAPAVSEGRQLLKRFGLRDDTTQSCNALLNCCLAIGDFRSFRSIRRVMKMKEVPQSMETKRIDIIVACREQRWYDAVRLYARMIAGIEKEEERSAKGEWQVVDAGRCGLRIDMLVATAVEKATPPQTEVGRSMLELVRKLVTEAIAKAPKGSLIGDAKTASPAAAPPMSELFGNSPTRQFINVPSL